MAKKRPYPDRSFRVFVSHATADKWIAKTICEKIDAVPGCSTFRDDRDIDGGDKISLTIKNEIRASDELLLLMTATSITRQWVILEVGVAWGNDIRIVPVCYDVSIQTVPVLSDVRAYPLNDLDRYLDQLNRRARRERP